jgi:hypothetical protein
MTDRWFSDEHLAALARPTMDRAIEAIDRGDIEEARALCDDMRSEWLMLHDLMVESVAGLISFVQAEHGDDGVADAWRYTFERVWKKHHDAIDSLDRRKVVELLARTWRAHSGSGVGQHPGAFEIVEDDEKVTFVMNPCGSGQRLVRKGAYEGELSYGTTDEAHDWSFGREDFPLYCTHCTFMNESLPLEWGGLPVYPTEPPTDYTKDPCVWHWYKRPEDIPAEYFERYGYEKPETGVSPTKT